MFNNFKLRRKFDNKNIIILRVKNLINFDHTDFTAKYI